MKTPQEVLRATAYEEDGTFKGHKYFEKAMVKYAKLYHENQVKNNGVLGNVGYCSCKERTDNWYGEDDINRCFDCEKVISEKEL